MTSLVMPASLVHAQQEDTKKQPKKEVVEPAEQVEQEEAAEANPSFLDRIIATELSQNQGTSTPAQTTVAATTTPVLPSPEDRTNTTPGDDINKEAEEVLNTNLRPETPAPAKPTKPSTTTPVASTTPAGTTDPVEPTIDGSSNSFSPNNYYIPLDNLSPEMTYALSFVAMIVGISGAVLIIRDPRTKTAPAGNWVPAPAGFTREPLLEP
ncbi:MAG: hypothetical protein M3Q73_02905 [bacterium]|nr:hypothetical protein [bacterium]